MTSLCPGAVIICDGPQCLALQAGLSVFPSNAPQHEQKHMVCPQLLPCGLPTDLPVGSSTTCVALVGDVPWPLRPFDTGLKGTITNQALQPPVVPGLPVFGLVQRIEYGIRTSQEHSPRTVQVTLSSLFFFFFFFFPRTGQYDRDCAGAVTGEGAEGFAEARADRVQSKRMDAGPEAGLRSMKRARCSRISVLRRQRPVECSRSSSSAGGGDM